MAIPPTKQRNAKREKARKGRKAEAARGQAQQFEDELSGHELNLLRLNAISSDQQDENWATARLAATTAIDTLDRAIETTLAEADRIDLELKGTL
jgi:hypothetical protein